MNTLEIFLVAACILAALFLLLRQQLQARRRPPSGYCTCTCRRNIPLRNPS